ncbi:MAG: UPF0280 family protein [Methanomassiliicoccales archaeon]|nr:UPF0280 family protein [Methanomassiliicoccales archaeon]NYT14555.1 UPF0280 family protein [Methanomassiliicoccales archaeon]
MLERTHFEIGETAVTILAEKEYLPLAQQSIFDTREIILRKIRRDPLFGNTLEPYESNEDEHPLIRRMGDASAKAGVGPMATVAGAVAQEAVEAMFRAGAKTAVVDNGGDIAMVLGQELMVGIYSGDRFTNLGFKCVPRDCPYGICSSSRTLGPSISFGKADLATVMSKNVLLADACATALGNWVEECSDEALRKALDRVCTISGVEGALIIAGEHLAMKGSLPQLVRVESGEHLITRKVLNVDE